jgi:hypothetical protein
MLRLTLFPNFTDILGSVFEMIGHRRTVQPQDTAETEAERRAHLREIIWANPESCRSKLNVQAMLSEFPRSF